MEQHNTVYCDRHISYWPYYTIGKIGICSLCILETVFLIVSLWSLSDKITENTCMEIAIAIPSVTLAFVTLCILLLNKMYTNIIVSLDGILICNAHKKTKYGIAWDDVNAIYIYQDSWYGRESYRISLRSNLTNKMARNNIQDFAIPVNGVDKKRLQVLIPSSLLKTD